MLPIKKLVVLATLGFCAVILGSAVLTLQLRVATEKQKRGLLGGGRTRKKATTTKSAAAANRRDNDVTYREGESGESASATTTRSTTIKQSLPAQPWDVHLWANDYPPREPTSVKSSADAYWSQALSFILNWDGYLYPDLGGHYTTTLDWSVPHWSEFGNRASYPRLALEKAAKLGNPMAQYYLGNAMASGIWPVPAGGGAGPKSTDNLQDGNKKRHGQQLLETELEVFDEIIPHRMEDSASYNQKTVTMSTNHPQVTKSYLLWHMAAMAGNVDAAMTLAYRMDHYQTTSGGYGDGGDQSTCDDSLPYYEAAANGIIDQLESSKHSRAKVLPPIDKHILAQVHMHGGTSSQLDWHNKPDESVDALQYYHLKATTTPWSMKQQLQQQQPQQHQSRGSDNGRKQQEHKAKRRVTTRKAEMMDVDGIDISAAFTLAHLYHYGHRGVEQNLTKALEYYEIAGSAGHWESSGHACTFYIWGMGVEQDLEEALVYCRLGAPMGVDGCRARHEKLISLSSNDEPEERVVECDDNALNGLGLLYLLGISGTLDVDLIVAEKYFALAKELGNADAHYNLAMMWLGWKTHFKHFSELKDDGVSGVDGMAAGDSRQLPIPQMEKESGSDSSKNDRYVLHVSKLGNNEVFKGPIHDDITNAIKFLTIAANKGHVQAKHRLAMIYADGLRLQTNALKYESVKKDCLKAKALYQWIVDNASPSRSRRLRTAYKEYIAGNLERSLRNYLTVAETGSSLGQVNAAFLLERGTCLGLNPSNCAKASVRMWKAAAARGSSEACLRVGDFYYYGRMREGGDLRVPFAWIQYILYPEKYMPSLISKVITKAQSVIARYLWDEIPFVSQQESDEVLSQTCEWRNAEEGSCSDASVDTATVKLQQEIDADLLMAAHYYTVAVEKHQSGRANFNLGFMHEWGLGLTQDFPLAKRHYDLAATTNPIAVQLALIFLSRHEAFLRWMSSINKWWNGEESDYGYGLTSNTVEGAQPSPRNIESAVERVPMTGREIGGGSNSRKTIKARTREDVIMAHLFNASSLVIVILVAIVIQIYTIMRSRQRQGRR
jgi:SEL1 protein